MLVTILATTKILVGILTVLLVGQILMLVIE